MSTRQSTCLLILSALILALSSIAFIINHFYFHFVGNNYFPEHTSVMFLVVILINLGTRLFFGSDHPLMQRCYELIYFFLVMSLIAFATNAIQLTPFPTIDHLIIQFEHILHLDLINIIQWTNQYPSIKKLLAIIYDSLPYQMTYLPLLCIATGKFTRLHNYYFLMLFTVVIGFTMYYLFPTVAPAISFNSNLFAASQFATGIKFNEIHQHMLPSTLDGGLIAMPSFHVIWAMLCIYLTLEWSILSYLLGAINTLLIASCILLGWHYVSDVVVAIILVVIAYWALLKTSS